VQSIDTYVNVKAVERDGDISVIKTCLRTVVAMMKMIPQQLRAYVADGKEQNGDRNEDDESLGHAVC
jgi:hypothetical protein